MHEHCQLAKLAVRASARVCIDYNMVCHIWSEREGGREGEREREREVSIIFCRYIFLLEQPLMLYRY